MESQYFYKYIRGNRKQNNKEYNQKLIAWKDQTDRSWDFPGGPVAKTLLPMQGTQVQSLVKELDPECLN